MRLWSLHPRHLDTRALVACWREGLLAYHVLQGKTKGYKHHPQLLRFRACEHPIASLESYLHGICDEADARGYHFARSKLGLPKAGLPRRESQERIHSSQGRAPEKIPLTHGQLAYEFEHLRKKVEIRSPKELSRLEGAIAPHPIFRLIDGEIEDWERV